MGIDMRGEEAEGGAEVELRGRWLSGACFGFDVKRRAFVLFCFCSGPFPRRAHRQKDRQAADAEQLLRPA